MLCINFVINERNEYMDIKDLEKTLNDVMKSPEDTDLQEKYCDSIVEFLNSNEQVDEILPIVIEGIDIDRAANFFDYLEDASNKSLKKLWKKLRSDNSVKEANSVNVLKFLSGLLWMSFMGAGNLGNHFGNIMTLLVECIHAPQNAILAEVYGPILCDYIFDDLDQKSTLPKWEAIKDFEGKGKEFCTIILNSTDGDNADQYMFIRKWASRGIRYADEKIEKKRVSEEVHENNNKDIAKRVEQFQVEENLVRDDSSKGNHSINITNTNADQEAYETEETVKRNVVITQPSQESGTDDKAVDIGRTGNKNVSETDQELSAQSDNKVDEAEEEHQTITLEDKSDLFKKIIDIALTCEKLESDNKKLELNRKKQNTERKKLKEKNAELNELNEKLKEENKVLIQRLKEGETLYQSSLEKINQLQIELAQRNEVITIVKADKDESAMEYKNALASSLKAFYTDYVELRELGTQDDIALALIDTFENVFRILESNGVNIN